MSIRSRAAAALVSLAVVGSTAVSAHATAPSRHGKEITRTRCAQPHGVVHRIAPGRGKTVALTFDDGPGRDTRRILDILTRAHVTATFFNLGVNETQHRQLVRYEYHQGFLLADHTWDHQTLTTLDAAGQASEIDRERHLQAKVTGDHSCLLRPPGGSYDASLVRVAAARGMQLWNWSVDTEDWKANGSADRYWQQRILSRAIAGGSQRNPCILMHNQPSGNPATVAALPWIIQYYKRHGYRFVDLYGNVAR